MSLARAVPGRNSNNATGVFRSPGWDVGTITARIQVVAGILCDVDGRVLCTERIGDAAFAGLWEFPGGKIDSGETAEAALHRELQEELGIDIESLNFFQSITHDYADRRVHIEFFLVSSWRGKPSGRQGQRLSWLGINALDESQLLPADAPIVNALKDLNSPHPSSPTR